MYTPWGIWKAVNESGIWKVYDKENNLICTLAESEDAENKAKQIAASPYVLEALKLMVALLGDEDMADNGELSGAAISDMARAAIDKEVRQ
tara:strand:- start:28 stop:300 length:273 start_codon:yes stop_codon:yes gene_type:complete